MACGFDCNATMVMLEMLEDQNRDICNYLGEAMVAGCQPDVLDNITALYNQNCTSPIGVNVERGFTAVLIFVVSLIGNTCTIALLSKFKIHKIPDVLVVGLAITDLVAATIPVPFSIYAYFSGFRFMHNSAECIIYATVAQFTRYASVLIVTIVSIERYLAVIHPFFYRRHATPKKVAVILVFCWLAAIALSIVPALDPCTSILPHEGFCLFDVDSDYAYSIIVYGAVQYIIVLFCFVAVSVQLSLVYRRRQRLRVQDKYNKQSNAQDRQHEVKFSKPNLTTRISDLSKSLRKAAPLVVEKFQFGVEAQFAVMLFAVVFLFYLTWTAILVVIIIAEVQDSSEGLEDAIFWGIRFSVIATAINPLLYGILARQYRLAYWYVIKLVLSKCCRCVSPPLKDVFAAARAPAGDVRSENSEYNRRKRFRQQDGSVGRQSIGTESTWSKSTGAVLTRTTAHTHLTNGRDLEAIEELDYSCNNPDSVIEEHSTYVNSAGELASTVIIPHQGREKNSETDLTRNTLRATASLDNLVDGLISDFGYSQDVQVGVENPLVNVLAEGEEMSSSEQGSTTEDGFQIGRLYSNPVYQIELARRQRESQVLSSLVAASSADDITLVSKVPLHKPAVNSTLTTTSATLPNNHPMSKSMDQIAPEGSQTWLTRTNTNEGNKDSEEVPAKEVKDEKVHLEDKRLDHMKRLQPLSRSQEFDIHAATGQRRPKTIEPVSNGVNVLRMKYESSKPPAAHIPPTLHPTRITPSLQPNGKSGRCNSVGNSDSGRESMVLETDV